MTENKNQNVRFSTMFEIFFRHASIGIVVVDAAGNIIGTNPFLLNMFGYEENGLVGQKIEVLIPRRFGQQHEHHRNHYIEAPKSRPMGIGMELFGVRKDGREFPVEVSLGNYESENERFVVAYVIDITLRMRDRDHIERLYSELEETVENRTKELSRTLQVLSLLNEKLENTLINQKAILDNARVMLFVMNTNGLIQFFNPEASRLTGYKEQEVVNKYSCTLFQLPEEIEACRKHLEGSYGLQLQTDFDVIREKANRNEIHEMECSFIRKDQVTVPVSLTITPILDKKNLITGYMGVAIDISERKKAELDLREALSKEKKLGELKSRFVSMASHEFRTPLSTILSSTYLVEKYTEGAEQPKREKHLQRIISSVNNLTNILDEFLSVGKIEEGKIGVHYSAFDLQKLMTMIIQDMQSILKASQKLEYKYQGDHAIELDGSLLKNIIMNLISNAIKFSPDHGVISIFTEVNEEHINIHVADQGIGISKEDQDHLMERFFRGSNATNIQGTGLGLHIVSKYVERMNGKLTYTSELDKGTTFYILFPKTKIINHEDNFTD